MSPSPKLPGRRRLRPAAIVAAAGVVVMPATAIVLSATASNGAAATNPDAATTSPDGASLFDFYALPAAQRNAFLDSLDVNDPIWTDNLHAFLRGAPLPTTTTSSTSTSTTTSTTAAPPVARQFVGSNDYSFGTLKVTITVEGTRITAVHADGPPDPASTAINATVFPKLESGALAAQSATFATDSISGATFTVPAFKTALQAAITSAGLR